MNVQRLKAALEATGCPILVVRSPSPGVGEYVPGPGATPQQIAAANAVLAQHQSGDDIEYEKGLVRAAAEAAFDIGFGRQADRFELALRAFFLMIVEDRYTTVTRFNALLAEIAAATSLADLKTRVANMTPLQTYGANQSNAINAIKNALKQRINQGLVD